MDAKRTPVTTTSLADGFLSSAEAHPERPALEVAGVRLTYAELRDRAAAIAATLADRAIVGDVPLTAVLGARSTVAFAGVLGALLRGHGYVPLNPRFPAERNRAMLERSGCRALVVDPSGIPLLSDLLAGVTTRLTILVPDVHDVAELRDLLPAHEVLGGGGLLSASAWRRPAPPARDAIAYLLFTSGSTGTPKGVMVAHRNATAFMEVMQQHYGFGPEDRLSQTFDLTFDLSVFDMFMAWGAGACLCCLPEAELMAPGRFLRESALTSWFSVPSTGAFMRRMGMLKPASYPTLRWSLFCGEPLPVETTRAWAAAAPGSIVENLYGPTELTIACTLHRWEDPSSAEQAVHGVVPIGEPFPGMRVLVADDEQREVAPGDDGELLLAGPQVTLGYWRDPERTAQAFVVPPGTDEVHYRTGDRVRRPAAPGEPLVYLGRTDHQLKVLGHRVELGEIEAVLREESGCDAVVAIGWPLTESGAGGIAAFVGDPAVVVPALLERAARRLPPYMVPRRIELLAELPLNANGKYDRGALTELLSRPRQEAMA